MVSANNHKQNERRRYERYPSEVKVYFSVVYDVRAKVKFRVVDKNNECQVLSERLPAISKDVSAEGMRITCRKELKKGDLLDLEVHAPGRSDPLNMEGEVRWSQPLSGSDRFDIGVKLSTINGKIVTVSVYHDGANEIVWSSILESVFGDFKKIAQKRYALPANKI
ncbi:MAG: PilZ domain-containing protein [Candidatus Omnitrophica bacterium]|nr:PilZ domain-containing protein [Candidatus Omnitrophota bacterium]MDD5355829.1 PilZ domain-containing protein [Candidatus Omnitrophota bacterium]